VGRWSRVVLALLPLIAYLAVVCADYAYLHVYSWRSGCSVEVFDVYGYARGTVGSCYYGRLELRDYLHLGETDAEVIIIATHYFTSPSGEVGLGTSESVAIYYPLLHPVRALQIVKGVLPGATYAAVPPHVIERSDLRGRTVVLLTCNLPRIEEVAEAFTRAGARLVLVSNTPALQPSQLRYLLQLVLDSLGNLEGLCTTGLFLCYGGRGGG
jgi:hypothetical protein